MFEKITTFFKNLFVAKEKPDASSHVEEKASTQPVTRNDRYQIPSTWKKQYSDEPRGLQKLANADHHRAKSTHKKMTSGMKGEKALANRLERLLHPNALTKWHDYNFIYSKGKAQIDFLVVSPYGIHILESKYWKGPITFDRHGQIKNGKYVYDQNPFDQVNQQKHALYERLSKVVPLTKEMITTHIVFTYPEVTIDFSDAPESYVMMATPLNTLSLRCEEQSKKPVVWSEQDMKRVIDYIHSVELDSIEQALRDYRTSQAKERRVPPYTIFKDEHIEALLEEYPLTMEQLEQVSGFGGSGKRRKAYGQDILTILKGA